MSDRLKTLAPEVRGEIEQAEQAARAGRESFPGDWTCLDNDEFVEGGEGW